MDVIERVRAAAAHYSDETFEASGRGSPFSDLFDEEDVEEDAEADTGPVPDSAERIGITGRWDFVVADRGTWFAHVTRKLEELGVADCVVELNSTAQAAHALLTQDPPFGACTLHGLADGGQDWAVERIPKVLSEMPDGEGRA